MSTGNRVQRRQLADILVDEGIVSREDVDEALHIRRTTGEALGAILVDMGKLAGPDLAKVTCGHFQLPFVSFRNYEFDSRLAALFPPEFLHQHKIVPFDSIGPMLLCAVIEVPPEKVLAEIPRITRRKVAFFVGDLDEIQKLLDQHSPLSEESQLLARRKHVRPRKSPEHDKADGALFTEQSSEQILEALDSTWASIFDEIEGGDGKDDASRETS